MNRSKGFTIIEIIVVIAIITVLASVVIISVSQYIQRAKDARAMADLQEIVKAAKLDYIHCGDWAPDVNGVQKFAPRFAAGGINAGACTDREIFYKGSFLAKYYCNINNNAMCLYDYDNWSDTGGRGTCVGVDVYGPRKSGVNYGRLVHGCPIDISGCGPNDVYVVKGSNGCW
jgi:prepilin-type N-terminal cleavage/methylation domain-containing protein